MKEDGLRMRDLNFESEQHNHIRGLIWQAVVTIIR